MPHPLVDIGINLTDRSFGSDRDRVIERALAAGVHRMVLTGTRVEESRQARDLAQTRPGVLFATAGVHPHAAAECDAGTVPALRALLEDPAVVAVGECGLDFFRDLSPRPVQERWFAAQLELACEMQMPAFVHDRDAATEVRAMLAAHRDRLPRAVVHCFTGTREELDAYLDLDLHIGITGWICDERRGTHLRELVSRIPPDRLMLETDAPYLLPRSIRPRPKSRRNEPAFLVHVLATVAECLGRPAAEIADATTRTANEFFDLPSP